MTGDISEIPDEAVARIRQMLKNGISIARIKRIIHHDFQNLDVTSADVRRIRAAMGELCVLTVELDA